MISHGSKLLAFCLWVRWATEHSQNTVRPDKTNVSPGKSLDWFSLYVPPVTQVRRVKPQRRGTLKTRHPQAGALCSLLFGGGVVPSIHVLSKGFPSITHCPWSLSVCRDSLYYPSTYHAPFSALFVARLSRATKLRLSLRRLSRSGCLPSKATAKMTSVDGENSRRFPAFQFLSCSGGFHLGWGCLGWFSLVVDVFRK